MIVVCQSATLYEREQCGKDTLQGKGDSVEGRNDGKQHGFGGGRLWLLKKDGYGRYMMSSKDRQHVNYPHIPMQKKSQS